MEKSEVPSEEKKKISKASLAQPAERTAVNREVIGSIPIGSAFFVFPVSNHISNISLNLRYVCNQ